MIVCVGEVVTGEKMGLMVREGLKVSARGLVRIGGVVTDGIGEGVTVSLKRSLCVGGVVTDSLGEWVSVLERGPVCVGGVVTDGVGEGVIVSRCFFSLCRSSSDR